MHHRYHRLVPRSYSISLVYDYRDHGALPTEHWVDGSISLHVPDGLQWFGGYRQSFGDVRYNGRLFRTGLSAAVAPRWQVGATVYLSQQAAFRDYRSLWSGVMDVTYSGPRNMLYVATMNDRVYAFDADRAGPPLWLRNLTDELAGTTPVPVTDVTNFPCASYTRM